MLWASAISKEPSLPDAISSCISKLKGVLGTDDVSLAFVFVTPHFAAHYEELLETISTELDPQLVVGCSGGGVIGGLKEIEDAPALSIVAARLPDVRLHPFRLSSNDRLPDLDGPPDAWQRLVGTDPADTRAILLFSDPFAASTETLVAGLDFAYPDAPKVGGIASGGNSPGTNALFLDSEIHTEGIVGVALCGDISVETVVAQGCRPVGEIMTATSCEGNLLHELDGIPALEAAREMLASLDERDVRLAQSALFMGVVMDEFVEDPVPGQFLVRNVIGADPSSGSLAIGENLQPGMRLKFHVRDAATSAEDLTFLLANRKSQSNPDGAILFSCLGRGENLYGTPDFDSDLFRREVGDVPIGGFFCNGEIGPVGGSTFLHGYTSSFAIFSSPET